MILGIFVGGNMLAKLSAKNQLTIPKAIVSKIDNPEYFDVVFENGRIILTPVSVSRQEITRCKLATLGITEEDIENAIRWSRNK